MLLALALIGWAVRVEAFPMYDDGIGNGCVSCHPAFFGVSGLHSNHLNTFGIGNSECILCHQTTAGEKPVLTYWSNGGFGCSGCHGQDYGENIPSGLGLSHEGNPKSSGYGLRRKHALIFAGLSQPNVCATCHFPGSTFTGDPDPAPSFLPETVPPPYYGLSGITLTDPCDSSQESFSGTPPGLDNDGNGDADMDDSACAAFVSTTTTTQVTTTVTTSSTTTTTFPGTARRITVYPGQSIQDAVDAVKPGGTVYIMPGTYQEMHSGQDAVTVSKPGIRLIARSKPKQGLKVILKAWGSQRNGVVVQPLVAGTRIDGFQLKGLTVEGFPNNGILTRYVDNFKIERNESKNNLENGIWPTLSANGLVKRNVSYGSEDSALWVEASENIRVIKNELYDSPTGLEITVSQNVLAKHNDVHDNTVGIGLYHALGAGLPPLEPLERNGDWEITDNHVYNNNSTNSAPPGSLSAMLPPGIGILVVGVDRVNVAKNRVENNNTIGLAVADWCLVTTCPVPYPAGIPDSVPDHNTFVSNVFTNNATAPASGYEALSAEITYVVVPGTPTNCFANNMYSGTFLKVGTLTEANKCD